VLLFYVLYSLLECNYKTAENEWHYELMSMFFFSIVISVFLYLSSLYILFWLFVNETPVIHVGLSSSVSGISPQNQ
jgi:hypothetical protein